MARIIILDGHNEDTIRMTGTAMEVCFPDSQLEFMVAQSRHALDLAGKVFVTQKVSETRGRNPAPGSNAAIVDGCSCQGPTQGSNLQRYILDKNCKVHKGRWPTYT